MLNNINPKEFKKIFLACGYTDLRNGIDGLAAIVSYKFELNPFDEGTLFLFCGRDCRKIKGLLWEGDGFLLLSKRLENGRYRWPRNSEEAIELSDRQVRWLMEGLEINQKKVVHNVYPEYIL